MIGNEDDDTSECPECGEPLELEVDLEESMEEEDTLEVMSFRLDQLVQTLEENGALPIYIDAYNLEKYYVQMSFIGKKYLNIYKDGSYETNSKTITKIIKEHFELD
jgi:hypothetical protein